MRFGRRKKMKVDNSAEVTLSFLNTLGLSDVPKNKLSDATYYTCLRLLSEGVGKLPLKLLRHTDDGGVVRAYDHSHFGLTKNPNGYENSTIFWTRVEQLRNQYGNSYVWIKRARQADRTKLFILDPRKVEIVVDDKGNLGEVDGAIYYFYDEKYIPSDSMIHLRTPISTDGIKGKAVGEILASTIESNLKAQKMLSKQYDNAFMGMLALQYVGELDEPKRKKYAEQIKGFADKGGQYGNIIPLMVGSELKPINPKLADNQFLELKKYSALEIAAAFGIKPNQINNYDKSSYASAEAQQLDFYVGTLLWILKQYEEELTNKLLSSDDIKKGYFFKFNVSAILRADLKTQIESLKTGVQGGIYTPNEARGFLDLPGKKGGDILLVNGNMMPAEMAGIQYNKKEEKI